MKRINIKLQKIYITFFFLFRKCSITYTKKRTCLSFCYVLDATTVQVCNSNFVSKVPHSQHRLGISVTKTTFRICEFLAAAFFSSNTYRIHHRLYSPS